MNLSKLGQSKSLSKEEVNSLLDFLIIRLPAIFLSLSLFIGGIVILFLKLPGWSIILGIPAVQIGLIFLIFSFDEIARKRYGPSSLKDVRCLNCGKPFLIRWGDQNEICPECQKEIGKKRKGS
jgi:hypothetical protein